MGEMGTLMPRVPQSDANDLARLPAVQTWANDEEELGTLGETRVVSIPGRTEEWCNFYKPVTLLREFRRRH